ncbi:DMT family transporter [Psychrobacter sp. DAB_AL62B]|uniref:DMT family transporter n=1 Tax=Psychrobacter sp. DAB_AL62B TaxID=1028420 RepID=UPI0023818FCE|nr:DMT family transporter [Psychrobacter sp. DAB_AL62B]MDE4453995.1 DMT family transporter [Psychrobacter sp. DAB_AL62B]
MKILPYVLISLSGGAIVPLQLAIVNAFRESTQASQIQSTFYLYLGGALASLVLSYVMSGGIKPPMIENATWWMWLPGFLGSFYILFIFIAAPKIGAGNTLLWVFLGQMYFALILSQTGLFGLEVKAIDIYKIAGLALVTIGGMLMIYGETRVNG